MSPEAELDDMFGITKILKESFWNHLHGKTESNNDEKSSPKQFQQKYFLTKQDAAYNWAGQYAKPSTENNREFGGSIFSIIIEGQKFFSYNEPAQGDEGDNGNYSVSWNERIPDGARLEGVIHSHPNSLADISGVSGDFFSSNTGMVGRPGDVQVMNREDKSYGKVDWFLATANRELKISSADNRTRGLNLMSDIGSANPRPSGIWDGTNGQPVFLPSDRPPLIGNKPPITNWPHPLPF